MLSACPASAARISAADAACAARAFAAEGRHLGVRIGGHPLSARRHTVADGADFYAVRLSSGTVFLSGDDEREPVIAYTSEDVDFDSLPADAPLHALLERDARLRGGTSDAKAKWRRLFAKGEAEAPYPSLLSVAALSAASLSEPGDIRVPALVETRWGQTTDLSGARCFNLDTPGHAYCGCIATAMAQVMRFHRWPDAAHPVEAKSFQCYTNDSGVVLTTQGGVYDWDRMPTDAAGDRISSSDQRQEIGKLTSDAGISVRMYYTSAGSSTYAMLAANAFTDTWRYGQAIYFNDSKYHYLNGRSTEANRRTVLEKIFFSNIDAGCPVLLGISKGTIGHCVVADGYGYDGETDYVHLNVGWSGSCDLWYNLPAVSVPGYDFTSADEVVYNVFPTNGTGCAVFSGRVLDQFGRGIAGASVRIFPSGSTVPSVSLTTSGTGVYGAVLTGKRSYDVVAVTPDGTSTGSLKKVFLSAPSSRSESYGVEFIGQLETVVSKRNVTSISSIGNSWGNDIVLCTARTAATNFYVSAATGVDAPDRGTSAAPFATIQYAITNGQTLVAGDAVNVLPGTYFGCVETPETPVTIVATEGPEVTILDGEGLDSCYDGSANPTNLLAGFTLTNGMYTGGVFFGTVRDCVITDCENTTAYGGGGAYAATLCDCVLRGNRAYYGGGASESTLTNCLLVGNLTGYYWDRYYGYCGGIGGGACLCRLVNCTLAGNVSQFAGGGAYLDGQDLALNTLVSGNTCLSGSEYGNDVYGDGCWTMSNTLVDVDARFRDAANGDYRVLPTSPAFDAGSADFVAVDHDLAGNGRVWGRSVDIGCYEYHLPDGVADCDELGIAGALAQEGYRGAFAATLTEPKDYAYLVEWTLDRGLSPSDLNAAPTGILSPALNADGLLALAPTDVVIRAFAPTGSDWRVAVSLPGYDRTRINEPLLKAAVGVAGSAAAGGGYSSEGLVQTVVPTATNVEVTVTPPCAAGDFLFRAFVR